MDWDDEGRRGGLGEGEKERERTTESLREGGSWPVAGEEVEVEGAGEPIDRSRSGEDEVDKAFLASDSFRCRSSSQGGIGGLALSIFEGF